MFNGLIVGPPLYNHKESLFEAPNCHPHETLLAAFETDKYEPLKAVSLPSFFTFIYSLAVTLLENVAAPVEAKFKTVVEVELLYNLN